MGDFRSLEDLADKCYYRDGNHENALLYYYKSLEANSSIHTLTQRDGIVDCLLTLRRWDEALNFLNQTLHLYPNNFSGLYQKCNLLLALGKVQDCEPVLEAMKSMCKTHPNDNGRKIQYYARKSQILVHFPGMKKKALKINQKALDLVTRLNGYQNEWKIFLLTDLALYQLELGQYVRAIQVCAEVLNSPIKTYWDTAKIYSAEAYYYLSKYNEAFKVLNSKVNNMFNSSFYILLAVLYAATEKKEESMKYLTKSQEEIDKGRITYFGRRFQIYYSGRVYQLLGDYIQALAKYNQAYEIEKEYRLLQKWKSECEKKLKEGFFKF